MDIGTLRIIVEVLSFAAFIGIAAWAYSPRRRASLDEVGRSVLDD
jgi:cbb3-type cytochrome oxidase subunit 3